MHRLMSHAAGPSADGESHVDRKRARPIVRKADCEAPTGHMPTARAWANHERIHWAFGPRWAAASRPRQRLELQPQRCRVLTASCPRRWCARDRRHGRLISGAFAVSHAALTAKSALRSQGLNAQFGPQWRLSGQHHVRVGSPGSTCRAACSRTTCCNAPAVVVAASSPSSPILRSHRRCSPRSACPANR